MKSFEVQNHYRLGKRKIYEKICLDPRNNVTTDLENRRVSQDNSYVNFQELGKCAATVTYSMQDEISEVLLDVRGKERSR